MVEGLKNNAWKKRREKWEALVEQEIASLKTSIEELSDNENFATMIVKTTELAMKTSKEEKLKYLASALKGSISTNLSEDKMIIFMALLEKYTVSHIRLLSFFRDPKEYIGIEIEPCGNKKDRYDYEKKHKDYFLLMHKNIVEIFDKCYEDLYSDGMISEDSRSSGNGAVSKKITTILGEEFLMLIQERGNG